MEVFRGGQFSVNATMRNSTPISLTPLYDGRQDQRHLLWIGLGIIFLIIISIYFVYKLKRKLCNLHNADNASEP